VIVMGHITINNVNRVVDKFSGRNYETMEIIGPQMVLTMKMITFGWNVYDGRRKVEIPFRTWTNGKPQKGSQNTHPCLNSSDTHSTFLEF